jgi:hypothetical protein
MGLPLSSREIDDQPRAVENVTADYNFMAVDGAFSFPPTHRVAVGCGSSTPSHGLRRCGGATGRRGNGYGRRRGCDNHRRRDNLSFSK